DNDDDDGPLGGIDVTSLEVNSPPSNGIINIDAATGVITYMPNLDFVGMDTFTYTVCDTGYPLPAECGTAQVVITVTNDLGPDLVPNIIILPSVVSGITNISIFLEINEINNMSTDGSTITVIV